MDGAHQSHTLFWSLIPVSDVEAANALNHTLLFIQYEADAKAALNLSQSKI